MQNSNAAGWAMDRSLPGPLKIVLVAVADLSVDGLCTAPQAELAERAGYSPRQLRRILSQLCLSEYGFLSREIRPGNGAGRQTDAYRLSMPAAQEDKVADCQFVPLPPVKMAESVEKSSQYGRLPTDNMAESPDAVAVSAQIEAIGHPPHTPQLDNLLPQSSSCSVATPLAPQAEPVVVEQPVLAKPKRAKAEKRGQRISPDWRPSVDDREYAVTAGVPAARVDRLAEEFRDYWLGASQVTAWKLDWSATWRNQVRRFIDRNPHLAPQPQNLFTAQGGEILEHGNVTRLDPHWGTQRRFEEAHGASGHGSKPRGRFEILRDAYSTGGTF